jgi:hypothetical protein
MGSKEDYIPGNDREMIDWAKAFATQLSALAAEFGVPPETVAAIQACGTEFDAAVQKHFGKQIEARSARAGKDSVRRSLERLVRPVAGFVNQHPNMTNPIRAQLGLNQYKDGRSRRGVGAEIPLVSLETVPGAVIVHCGSTPSNEMLNGKPRWAMGCNIYRKKAGEDEWRLIACTPTSPYMDEIDEESVQVSYVVRHVAKRNGEMGGGSLTSSIAAGGYGLRKAA